MKNKKISEGMKRFHANNQDHRKAMLHGHYKARQDSVKHAEWNRKISESNMGRVKSSVTKAKISDSLVGVKHSEERSFNKGLKQQNSESGTNASKLDRKTAWHIKFHEERSIANALIIANKYNITTCSVYNIWNEKTWKWLENDEY